MAFIRPSALDVIRWRFPERCARASRALEGAAATIERGAVRVLDATDRARILDSLVAPTTCAALNLAHRLDRAAAALRPGSC